MNSAKAITRYARISPRKVVGLAKLVRGRDVAVARTILMRTPRKASELITKTLNSAIANAQIKNMDTKKLVISQIRADGGPALKRSIPWSRGSARPIKKRTTHLIVEVTEKEIVAKPKKEKKETVVVKKAAKAPAKKKETKEKVVKKEKEEEKTEIVEEVINPEAAPEVEVKTEAVVETPEEVAPEETTTPEEEKAE